MMQGGVLVWIGVVILMELCEVVWDEVVLEVLCVWFGFVKLKVLYDVKLQVKVLLCQGICFGGFVYDMSFVGWLLWLSFLDKIFVDLVEWYLGEKFFVVDFLQFVFEMEGVMFFQEVWFVLCVVEVLCEDIFEFVVMVFDEIELLILFIFVDMEIVGVVVLYEVFLMFFGEFVVCVDVFVQEVFFVVGCEFNLGFLKQLQEVLFEDFQFFKMCKMKMGYLIDVVVLVDLQESYLYLFLSFLLQYCEVIKLCQIIEFFDMVIGDDYWVYMIYVQIGSQIG